MDEHYEPVVDEQVAPLLELTGITKTFGGVRALDGISFSLLPGEIHALAGENGAGKSTFVKVLAGAYLPDAGSIAIAGRPVQRLSPRSAREQGIAVVHQEFNLIPDLSVAENVFLGALPRGRSGTVSVRRSVAEAERILRRLGSDLNPKQLVGDLAVAEQQLVEVAKALATDARIIVMDEPSTVLSTEEVDVLHDVVRHLRDDGRGIVYISHRLHEVFSLADRVTVFKDGGRVGTWATSEIDQDGLIRAMVGRPLVELFPQRQLAVQGPVLEVRGLTVPRKVADVSFTLRRGEILGLAGLGGSGRTTTARALVGLERVTSGEVLLDGAPAPRSPRSCARSGMVMVPEDRKAHGLLAGQSVASNLSLASLRELRRLQLLSRRRERHFAQRLVGEFGVRTPGTDAKIEKLSGGNQQKVVLARWLAQAPNVVVLDEPTRGVDVGAKSEIYAMIERLTEQGAGVLIASSDLPELLGTCDRILVLHEGRVAGEFTRADATEEAIVRVATGTVAPAPASPPETTLGHGAVKEEL